MTVPSVTFTGSEVAFIAGFIARALPVLDPQDYEVADLLLDRALAALPKELAPDITAEINRLRGRE